MGLTEGSEGDARRVRRSLRGSLSGVAEAATDNGRPMIRNVVTNGRSDDRCRRCLGGGMAVFGWGDLAEGDKEREGCVIERSWLRAKELGFGRAALQCIPRSWAVVAMWCGGVCSLVGGGAVVLRMMMMKKEWAGTAEEKAGVRVLYQIMPSLMWIVERGLLWVVYRVWGRGWWT